MMKPSHSSHFLVAFVLALLFVPGSAPQAADLETLTNREGSVTVKVTPKNIVSGAKSWDFEISLSTHTVPLDQDMTRVAVLTPGSGLPLAPRAWEGDPPGGHHRKGLLRFQPAPVLPQFFELDINGVGNVKRAFRWRLAR